MGNTRLAMTALGQAVTNAINAATAVGTIAVPTQVFIGWPTSTKLSDLMHEGSKQALVSIWPLKGKSTTRFKPTLAVLAQPSAGTTAALNTGGTTLTIGGTPAAGDVVHAFFGIPALDAAYLVTGTDTVDTVASAIAAAVNAFSSPGVSASAAGAVVTLTGATFSKVNVGGTGLMIREIGRIERLVQVTVWCNDPDGRLDVADVISTNVGNAQAPFLYASDGTAVFCQFQDDPMSDEASSSYSTFKQDLFFRVEYGLTQTVTGTQVGGTEYQQTVDSNPTQTAYFG